MRALSLTLVLLLLAGCGSAATPEGLPRLADGLRADGEAVLSKLSARFDDGAQDVVEDASQDEECADDGTRRIFHATGEVTSENDPSGGLELVETTLVGLFEERGYQLSGLPSHDGGEHEYTFGKQRLEFSATVQSGATTTYEIVGQTPCLG